MNRYWILFKVKRDNDVVTGLNNNPERHFGLLRILGTEFGDIAYIRPWDTDMSAGDLTIEMMDRYGKRIIILYNDENVVEGKHFGSFAPPNYQ